uniref:Uncharacterized protein n=1 Tax=Timema tahoe TaxID=61484 RepID=A0A7R9IP52_9NEOP|nr:unnamed protein product [Timema tahoe]
MTMARVAAAYNRGRLPVHVSLNDTVMCRNFPFSSAADRISAKLTPKWSGPWRISSFLTLVSVLLELVEDEIQSRRAHGDLVYALDLTLTASPPFLSSCVRSIGLLLKFFFRRLGKKWTDVFIVKPDVFNVVPEDSNQRTRRDWKSVHTDNHTPPDDSNQLTRREWKSVHVQTDNRTPPEDSNQRTRRDWKFVHVETDNHTPPDDTNQLTRMDWKSLYTDLLEPEVVLKEEKDFDYYQECCIPLVLPLAKKECYIPDENDESKFHCTYPITDLLEPEIVLKEEKNFDHHQECCIPLVLPLAKKECYVTRRDAAGLVCPIVDDEILEVVIPRLPPSPSWNSSSLLSSRQKLLLSMLLSLFTRHALVLLPGLTGSMLMLLVAARITSTPPRSRICLDLSRPDIVPALTCSVALHTTVLMVHGTTDPEDLLSTMFVVQLL